MSGQHSEHDAKRRRRRPMPLSTAQDKDAESPHVRNLLNQLAQAQSTSHTHKAPSTEMGEVLRATDRKEKKSDCESATHSSQPKSTQRSRRRLVFESKVNPPSRSAKGTSVAARMSKCSPSTRFLAPALSEVLVTLSTSGETMKRIRTHSHTALTRPPVSPQKGSQPVSSSMGPKIPSDVLDDLCFRFLLNIPEEEQRNEVRVCFQIELALWFYLDFYCKSEDRSDCREIGMREFTRQMFANCDFLKEFARNVDKVVDNWRHYKSHVPTYGAILLDSSLKHVLLVQGYYAKNSWGFPKGKVNESENPRKCAIREVFEETGYDFGVDRSNGGEHKLQKFVGDTMVRLYIVPDVPIDFPFAPITRKEIKKIQWFDVFELPTDKYSHSSSGNSNRFYSVLPFVNDLRSWILREQSRRARLNSKAPKGPQGKVSLRSKENQGQSAFTPVVPKSVNEKMTTAMDLMRNPECAPTSSRAEEKRKLVPHEALFRPLGNDSPPVTFSGNSFMQLWSSGFTTGPFTQPPPPAPTSEKTLAQPVPLKPRTDQPVYVAPREESTPRKKKLSTCSSSGGMAPSSTAAVAATEMEIELMRMLGKEITGEAQSDDSQSSGETMGKEDAGVERNTRSPSVVMANELPLAAAIIAAEKAAFEEAQSHHSAALHSALAVVAARAQAQAHQQAQAAVAALTGIDALGHPHPVFSADVFTAPTATAPPPSYSVPRSRHLSYVSENASSPHIYSPRSGNYMGSQQSLIGGVHAAASPPSTFSSYFPPRGANHAPATFISPRSAFVPVISGSANRSVPQQFSTPLSPVNVLEPIIVRLCDAWNQEFKLDTAAILAGLP